MESIEGKVICQIGFEASERPGIDIELLETGH